MNKEQRDAIVDAVAGLQIWCTDCGPTAAMEVYTGTEWSNETALITGLQAQLMDLQAQIDAMGSGTGGVNMPSVTIGDQEWTTKNLDVATYKDGTAIPEVTDATEWENLKTGAWCYYTKDDGTTDGGTYGKLYNWYAVMGITTEENATPTEAQIEARKQFAPAGWHVPSDAEWTTLTTFLGDNAGGKMKEIGDTHWGGSNTAATNSSGFTALPGGTRVPNGLFYEIGYNGYWWSSTESDTTNAWYRYLNYNNGFVNRTNNYKTFGFSVRCLRD
jgi:uncharacterized protein (TIGR02145 family)